eukprot:CAMPEP_0197020958 /NCGR_PEP_ID=MMETSP1384-20130603/1835_1 /TAXON_ID=29189 /ORGANISM="Ammonia sp." /LENGTH=71 /DNA_ID=CAMNT_0042448691 /DNA_START=1 /DNA_END=213 /DNA_ORIENTATION=-
MTPRRGAIDITGGCNTGRGPVCKSIRLGLPKACCANRSEMMSFLIMLRDIDEDDAKFFVVLFRRRKYDKWF